MFRNVRAGWLVLVFAVPAAADDWAGKLILFKADELQLGRKNDKGLILDGRKLTANAVYKVRTDDGTYLELVGQTGWIFKSGALPVDDAVAYFSEKVGGEPGAGKWYGRRGMARMNTGRNVTALVAGGKPTPALDAALADFSQAVKLEPAVDRWWSERGSCRFQRGEYDPAVADFTEAIRLKPNAAAYYSTRGIAYRAKREFDSALADYSKSIELDPKNAVTFNNRGLVYVDKKEYDRAEADYSEAVKLNPKYALAFNNRGDGRKKARRWAEAAADFRKAIELDPKYATAFNNLAWLNATCPDAAVRDGKGAVEWAKKAAELTPTANTRNTLAAAYAEAGEFDKAVAEIQKALDDPSLTAAARKVYTERLELYKAKTPYHEK